MEHEIRLYWADVRNVDDVRFEQLWEQVNQQTKNRTNLYMNYEDRVLTLCAGYLLKEQELFYDCNGKPCGENVYVSISHTYPYCVVCVSDFPCGVDVERADRDCMRQVHRVCTDGEKEMLTTQNCVELWCLKEALFKCFGLPVTADSREYTYQKANIPGCCCVVVGEGFLVENKTDI